MLDYDEEGPMRHDDPSTWPEVVYEPLGKITLRGSLAELWSYREVAWSFGMRKIRTRYKQAAFGFLWAVVQPLAFLALFMGFLGSGRNGPGSYAAGTFAALVAWQFVNSAIAGAGSSLVNEAGLLRKVFFPRECVVLGGVGSFLPDLLINLVLLIGFGWVFDARYSWNLLLVVPILVMVVGITTAFSIPLSALAVYYRDFLYALPFIAQVWFFGSPIAYSIDRVDTKWRGFYAVVNPLVGPMVALRRIVAAGAGPDWGLLGLSTASFLVLLGIGYRWFKSLEREFAEVV